MIENIKKSQQLESDLEIFLKRGGVIQELPKGYSGEVSGRWNNTQIHQKLKPLKSKEEIDLERKKRRAEEKALKDKIKKEQDKKVKLAREKFRKDRILLAEQKKLIKNFMNNAKHGHMARLIRITKVSRETMDRALYGERPMTVSRWNVLKPAIESFDFDYVFKRTEMNEAIK